MNAWAAVGAAGGVLAPGHPADLVLWGVDPVECPPGDLLGLPVRLTVVDGRIVHRAADL